MVVRELVRDYYNQLEDLRLVRNRVLDLGKDLTRIYKSLLDTPQVEELSLENFGVSENLVNLRINKARELFWKYQRISGNFLTVLGAHWRRVGWTCNTKSPWKVGTLGCRGPIRIAHTKENPNSISIKYGRFEDWLNSKNQHEDRQLFVLGTTESYWLPNRKEVLDCLGLGRDGGTFPLSNGFQGNTFIVIDPYKPDIFPKGYSPEELIVCRVLHYLGRSSKLLRQCFDNHPRLLANILKGQLGSAVELADKLWDVKPR